MKPELHSEPVNANNKNEAGKKCQKQRQRKREKSVSSPSECVVVITNHVTMLTRSLYMCVLPPICVCFMRNRHSASLIDMEIRTGFWFTSRRRGTRKNTSQEHISNAKSAVSTNQTINQSFNQSSGKKCV